MLRKVKTENGEETISLLPCPFCGKDIARFADCEQVRACSNWHECRSAKYVTVICSCMDNGCGTSVGYYPNPEQAATVWNHRV